MERKTDVLEGIYLYNWNIYVTSQNDKSAILPHERSMTKLMIWKKKNCKVCHILEDSGGICVDSENKLKPEYFQKCKIKKRSNYVVCCFFEQNYKISTYFTYTTSIYK